MTQTITAIAPVRLDLAGGWSDVPPFAAREGGAVTNVAIQQTVSVTVEPGGAETVIVSRDFDRRVVLSPGGAPVCQGLDLLAAAVHKKAFGPGVVISHSSVPPGSGLGASGSLGVALIGALRALAGEPLEPDAVAGEAYRLEAKEVKHPGGRQDQWAAAFGGLHRYRFHGEQVDAEPLRVDPGFLRLLEERLVVVYTGASRVSGETIARVMAAYERGDLPVTQALHAIRETGEAMAGALERGDLTAVGRLLDRNWAAQQQLDRAMCTATMARYEAAARKAGILGGKAVGAGAGGSMLFLAVDAGAVRRALVAEGAQVIPVAFRKRGWEVQGPGTPRGMP